MRAVISFIILNIFGFASCHGIKSMPMLVIILRKPDVGSERDLEGETILIEAVLKEKHDLHTAESPFLWFI